VPDPSAPAVTRTWVDLRHSSLVRRVAADYAFAHERLADFFAGAPTSADAWQSAIARTQAYPRERRALVDLLLAQQARRGAPPVARAAAERFADPKAVAVVTGQQAGVFGGPLYTLLKALTAVRLAAKATAEHGVPTVAVFWIDAEDHDWEEVASTTVLDADLHAHRLTLPPPRGAGERPVAALTLDERCRDMLADLRRLLPPTEFTPDLLSDLERSYAPGVGVADAFGQWLEHWLGPQGLVVFDAADPGAKPLARPVFHHELAHPGRTATLAAEAGARLRELGYHAQVETAADAVALFHLDGGRHAIRRQGQTLVSGVEHYTPAQLAALADAHPEQFSPNVLLRPIVQDTLFPTACYVSGPSELAYLGQLRRVYEAFGVPMPIVHPRIMATLLDAPARRFMTKYGLELEALQPQDEARLNRLLESQLPP
jgi:bacillithiol biosynthesis cysteine-adding enzyme BshC